MLYRIHADKDKSSLHPVSFLDFSAIGKLEKDLEILLADSLFEILFDDVPLMPIFQERPFQGEADIYALNQLGDLVIFELKRGLAGADAVHQLLRYAQEAGQWTFNQLVEKYASYQRENGAAKPLQEAHREAFDLERELLPNEFNSSQHLWVIGSAADDNLRSGVSYWRGKGLSIEFLPYRIYDIGGERYFEFFSLPYDYHINPIDSKGVLFDTCRTYDEDAVWDMIEKKRVAAYGDRTYCADCLQRRDIVFLCHKGTGIVAAAEVIGPTKHSDDGDEAYHNVKFLTPLPDRQKGINNVRAMPFNQVSAVTGKFFFWARTVKVPYLSRDEALLLLQELNKVLAD
jgi:hypothetical protein